MRSAPQLLPDPQSGELSLKVSLIDNAGSFARPQQHPYFSIILVRRGSGTAVRDGGDFSFESSCLLCFSIYQPYTINVEGEFEGIQIDFHPSFFCLFEHRHEVSCNGVLFNNLYDTPVVGLRPEECGTLTILAEQIAGELQRGDNPDKDVLISLLKVFLINASRIKMEQQRVGNFEALRMNPMLSALTTAIDAHYKTHRQAASYADLLHVSSSVLNRMSREYFRKTLTALIAERVIIEAKRQLYLTDKSVKEIAFGLGYADEFYFSRFFKKNVGVSPQTFRDKVGRGVA